MASRSRQHLQARLVSAGSGVALGGIAGELRPNRMPQRLIDDRRVVVPPGSVSSVRNLVGKSFRAKTK
jgi:hypothetical protein